VERKQCLATAIIGSLGLFGVLAWAQEPDAASAQGNAARFQVSSDLVLVPVTVITGKGVGVTGLTKDDFTVLDEKVPQVITHFTAEDAPASIGLIVDCSDSMSRRMEKAQEALFALLKIARPDDEFFLVRFSSHAEMEVGLTNQVEEIRRGVSELRVGGATAVLDAVRMAWNEMKHAKHPRKALILISDGEDNCSRLSPGEFKRLAADNETTVYTLFIGDFSDPSQWNRTSGMALLDDIAHHTGGRMFTVGRVKDMPKISSKIGSWIRSQYVLGYVPNDQTRSGGYHRIQVKVTKSSGMPKVKTSWRLGYYAPEPDGTAAR
jgi:Ca-activated chloride channel family protein